MAIAGTDITKDNITGSGGVDLNSFKQQITDVVNALTKTTSVSANGTALGQKPFGSGAPISGSLSSTNYGGTPPLSAPLVAPGTVTNSPQASDIAGANIAAATLITLFQNTAVLLSRVRRYSMVKTYLSPAPVIQLSLTEPGRYGYLTTTYQANPATTTPAITTSLAALTGDISAATLNTVIDNVDTAITNHRNTTVAFTETWCHSSCHSSHSSRNRR